jgi:hypothetical protein
MAFESMDGFGFDVDAFTFRFRAACAARSITSRAQFLTAWNAATPTQQLQFLAQMVFGSVRFPEDGHIGAQALAALGVP